MDLHPDSSPRTKLRLALNFARRPAGQPGLAPAQAQEPVNISIRAKARHRDLIDQAADRLGRSRSDFMLEAACRQAEEVLFDQTYFALDAKSMAAFRAMLDQPPASTERLRRTLKARAPWDTAGSTGKAAGPRRK